MSGALLVTGGGRGIGAATAVLAAARGYDVVVNYVRDGAAAEGVVARIRERGGRALAVQADVSHEREVEHLFQTVDAAFGPLAALVNNAAVVDTMARVTDIHEARLLRMLSINVVGSFLCAAAAVRRMSTVHGGLGGSIVNVSSAASRHGSPNEYVDYAASKAAIDTFTIGLAKEVALEGIRVNCVRPGLITTEIHAQSGDPDRPQKLAGRLPMRRPGTAEEVAHAILWLTSSDASYCTGTIVDVAGGY